MPDRCTPDYERTLMLKVRTSVMNRTFNKDSAAAERWARRPFRNAA
jgi:hypothetical protein